MREGPVWVRLSRMSTSMVATGSILSGSLLYGQGQRAAVPPPAQKERGQEATISTLEWAPVGAEADDPRPSIFTAMEEQLGLKLKPGQGPVDAIVIDSIQRPSEN